MQEDSISTQFRKLVREQKTAFIGCILLISGIGMVATIIQFQKVFFECSNGSTTELVAQMESFATECPVTIHLWQDISFKGSMEYFGRPDPTPPAAYLELRDPDGTLLRKADFANNSVQITVKPEKLGSYVATIYVLGDKSSAWNAHVTYQFGYLNALPVVSAIGFIGYLVAISGGVVLAASYLTSRSKLR